MSLDEAFHRPRIDVSGTDLVVMDDSLEGDVRAALATGFDAVDARRVAFPYHFACAGGVQRRNNRNYGANEKMSAWGDAVAETAT